MILQLRKHLRACLLLFFLSCCFLTKSRAQQSLTTIDGWNAYVHLPDDYYSNQNTYPVIIFMPGIGEIGTDPSKLLAYGPSMFVSQGNNMQFNVNGNIEKPIVISIQPVSAWPSPSTLNRKVDSILNRWRVNTNRVYLTGLSMGAWGWENYVTNSSAYSAKIAAIVAMSAPAPDNVANFTMYALGGGKWWGFEGTSDYRGMDIVRDLINAAVPGSARYTQYVGGHCCWNTWYNPTWTESGENIYQWMLKQAKNATINQPPTSNAGADKNITLPTNTLTVTGSGSDPDGTITGYQWTMLTGPATYTIATATQAQTAINNLVQGVYTFELRVTDNQGATGKDTVQVTVNEAGNQAPIANAGPDKSITLPTNTVTVIGSGTDSDGTITGYQWTKLAGPLTYMIATPSQAQTAINNLVQGVYAFELRVTDNQGASSRDTVSLLVLPQAAGNAVANAGTDTVIYLNQIRPDTAILNASGSQGAISYLWTKISGPGTQIISNPTAAVTNVLNIEEGSYLFKLTVDGTVADTIAVFAKDFMKKNVRPCRVGQPQAFTLVKNSATELYRPYLTRDNLVPNLLGGDTLYIPGGLYTTGIEIGDIGGGPGCPIIIAPKNEPVILQNDAYFRLASKDSAVICYAKFDGTLLESSGHPYGWIVDNSDKLPSQITGIGLSANWVHHLDISGYYSNHTGLALMVKLNAKPIVQGQYDKFLLRKVRIFDNYVFRSNGEGMYIGHTGIAGTQDGNSTPYGPPVRMDSVEIYNNIIDSTNWDGIQLSNALNGCKIYNNLVRRYGIANESSQQAGILSGGNISGVQIYNNMAVNGTGTGIVVFGYNTSNVYHNIVDSIHTGNNVEHGAYIKRNSVSPEAIPPLVPFVTGNIFKNAENYAVYTDYPPGTIGGSVSNNYFINNSHNSVANNSGATISNNTVISDFPISLNTVSNVSAGYNINITQADSTKNFTNVSTMVDWLFSRLNAPPPPNQSPTANAGSDKTITLPTNTVTVTGSGIDPDGTISGYQWTKLTGPATYTIATPTQAQTAINNLVQGVYTFELRVTDNQGATGKDTVQVTVNAANQSPTANAGSDKTITLPTNTVTITGSGIDPDGTISGYQWTKLTGPATYTIATPTQAQTAINNLVQGVYTFELRVTDNQGATGKDTVQVTVNAAANQSPTANAGSDKTITLPTNTVTVTGSGIDPDGTISGYQWTKLTGPSTYTIASPTQAQTLINDLIAGEYSFELRVTDIQGAVDRDTMVITVNEALENDRTFLIFPNPAVESINIQFDKGTDQNRSVISIYTISGILVYREEYVISPIERARPKQINISKLPAGTYFIKVDAGKSNSKGLKFIKQ